MLHNGQGARDDASVVKGALQPQDKTSETGSVPLPESGSTNLGQVQARVFLALLEEFFVTMKKPVPAERALDIARQFVSGNSQSGPAVMLNYLENDKKVILRDLSRSHYRAVIPRHSANVTIGERKDPLWPLDGWKDLPLPELVERIREVAGRVVKRGLVRVSALSPSSEVEASVVTPETSDAPVRLSENLGHYYAVLVEAGRKIDFAPQPTGWYNEVLERVPDHGFIPGVLHDFEKKEILRVVGGVKGSRSNPCIRVIDLRPYTVDGVNVIVPTADVSEVEPEPTASPPEPEAGPTRSVILPSKIKVEERLVKAKARLAQATEENERRQQKAAALNQEAEAAKAEIADLEARLATARTRLTLAETEFADVLPVESLQALVEDVNDWQWNLDWYDRIVKAFAD